MSDELKLLPPPASAKPFDLAAHAAKLAETPKEQYSAPEPEPPPAPEPPPGPDPGQKAADPGSSPDHEASAKEFIELYDLGQSWGFHFYSNGQPVESFALPAYAKDRAAHHLARGLEKMGGLDAPWWMGLVMAIGPPTAFNFMAAKQFRAAREAEAEAKRRGPGPVSPDEIEYLGEVINMKHQPRPAATPPPPAPAKNFGPCQQCGQPVKHKGRKYCGQSCAAKATNAKRAANKSKP